jgi:large subunit ribosomal protein L29
MAILRASEVRQKDDAELETDLSELRKTLMKIRGGLASGGIPEDVGKVREIKKTIARIMTIRHERKLGLNREQKVKHVAKEKETKAEPKHEAKKEAKKEAPKSEKHHAKKTTAKTKKPQKTHKEVTKKK